MLTLKLTDTKEFMNLLLKSDLFDRFHAQEAAVATDAAYSIDGRLNRDFFSKEELEELGLTDSRFVPFSFLRGHLFALIKGKKTPTSFRIVLLLSPNNLARTLESISGSLTPRDITAMYLNLRYQNQLLTLTTGVSYAVFSTDRTAETEWDRLVKQFLKNNKIPFEEL